MFTLKLVLVFGLISHFTLARPNKDTDGTQFDIEAFNSLSHDADDSIKQLLRRPRQNFFNIILSQALILTGLRGDWRFCRYTEKGASIYTNGIDYVCRGVCEETDITCSENYIPYLHNYFQ